MSEFGEGLVATCEMASVDQEHDAATANWLRKAIYRQLLKERAPTLARLAGGLFVIGWPEPHQPSITSAGAATQAPPAHSRGSLLRALVIVLVVLAFAGAEFYAPPPKRAPTRIIERSEDWDDPRAVPKIFPTTIPSASYSDGERLKKLTSEIDDLARRVRSDRARIEKIPLEDERAEKRDLVSNVQDFWRGNWSDAHCKNLDKIQRRIDQSLRQLEQSPSDEDSFRPKTCAK